MNPIRWANAIAAAVVSLLGEKAKPLYVKQPGAGYYRAIARLAKHRKQWDNTPVNEGTSRQVIRQNQRIMVKINEGGSAHG